MRYLLGVGLYSIAFFMFAANFGGLAATSANQGGGAVASFGYPWLPASLLLVGAGLVGRSLWE